MQVLSVPDEVSVAQAITLRLPGPMEVETGLSATQILSGRYEGETFDLQLNLEWRDDAIVVVAFNLFGSTLFTMSYDGRSITTVGSSLVLRGLDTNYVLADIMLTYLSSDVLAAHLFGPGLQIVEAPLERTIRRDGEAVIRIRYDDASRWNGNVQFDHLERGYGYRIETVQVSRQ
jgi:hypothetical protein